jgi:DNA mismatch repair protein MutS
MAGLPYKVIKRSKVLLESFMKDKKDLDSEYKENNINQSQLDLFSLNSELIDELKKIEIEELTPIQALNKLSEIKNKYEV